MEAKNHLPPHGVSIWKVRKDKGAWAAHVEGRARISEPYAGNEDLALRRLLKRVWKQWCKKEAKTIEEVCPWDFGDINEEAFPLPCE